MMNDTVLDRFLRYVAIDTQSSEESTSYPSTEKQLDLLKLLAGELRQMGLSNVSLDQWGYVMATLPGNVPKGHPAFGKVPAVGLIAHVDTSPSASGANVKPQVIQYRGGNIVLPGRCIRGHYGSRESRTEAEYRRKRLSLPTEQLCSERTTRQGLP